VEEGKTRSYYGLTGEIHILVGKHHEKHPLGRPRWIWIFGK
jgi:hypothetical protein